MPDASNSGPEEEPQAATVTIGSDAVGRGKITTIGYGVKRVKSLLTQSGSAFQPKPSMDAIPM